MNQQIINGILNALNKNIQDLNRDLDNFSVTVQNLQEVLKSQAPTPQNLSLKDQYPQYYTSQDEEETPQSAIPQEPNLKTGSPQTETKAPISRDALQIKNLIQQFSPEHANKVPISALFNQGLPEGKVLEAIDFLIQEGYVEQPTAGYVSLKT